MPSNEQRRQAAKRKLERQLERRAVRAKRRRVIGAAVTAVAVLLVGGGIYWLATSESTPDAAANPSDTSTTPPPPPGKKTEGPCKYTETPAEPAAKEAGLPPDVSPTPDKGTAQVDLKTSQGAIALTLDRAKAPCTVQSVTHLVAKKYFDNTVCHRMTTGEGLKVLQCGDPQGTGRGGPGYTIKDEKPKDLKQGQQGASIYPRGTLAMAKTQAPDSGGSQFFMVYADSQLPPEYTVFGSVSEEGLKVLDKVAAGGVEAPQGGQPGDGKPKLEVKIETATLKG
ncbi:MULTISPECIES: peptidylprolyl isomerase [unclassified Crossiella]|uniref:peptidylprolyl isomerase n=1 Tax=unclassified Crossiella TaxID=2620835 RepID=UPI001FFEB137|nr:MULTISPECIES: peptidylprolyl isomerase [unclassified Crossiella]MCK2239426.1 peptidylprolyl isomerase [Crossiella sp. S99.2]MCK2252121.1 peptidylprolyl isomerase [Crossiella sp. S99.1]